MKTKKALIFSLLFVFIIALISLPLAFASDTNTSLATSDSTNISETILAKSYVQVFHFLLIQQIFQKLQILEIF